MIVPKRVCIEWTEQEEQFLRENYRRLPAKNLADALGRTRNSVIGRASRIGLSLARSEAFREARAARFAEKRMPKIVPDQPTSANDYLSQNLLAVSSKRVDKTPRQNPVYTQAIKQDIKAEPLNGVGVSLWDARPNQCRWIIGEPKDMTFCGHEQRKGSSYCQSHFELSKAPSKEAVK